MADPNVIKEFLVGLGVRVDENGLRRFNEAITRTSKEAATLAAAITGTVVAIELAVRRVSRQFDTLYYLSQRTGVTVSDLKGIEFAFSQIGLSVGDADAALSGFAASLRDNPALRTLANQIVPGFKDAKQAIEGFAQEYARQAAQGPAAEAAFRAMLQNFGVNAEMIRQMSVNLVALHEAEARSLQILKDLGLNSEDAAKQAVAYTRTLHEFELTLSTVWQRFVTQIGPAAEEVLKGLNKVLIDNKDAINDAATRFGEWIKTDAVSAIARAFKELGDFIDRIDWKQVGDGIRGTTKDLSDMWQVLKQIKGAFEWIAAHPSLIGALGGATAGGAYGGPLGAVVGAVAGLTAGSVAGASKADTQYNRALHDYQRAHALGQDRRTLQQFFDDYYEAHPGAPHNPAPGAEADIPRYQHGGIVRAGLHEGEMVLPRTISEGLQRLFAGGRNEIGGEAIRMAFVSLGVWLYRGGLEPIVRLADETIDRLLGKSVVSGGGEGGAGGVAPQGTRSGGRFGALGPGRPIASLAQNVYEAISRAEGTFGPGGIDYNKVFGGGTANLTDMTLAEVMKFQDELRSRSGSSAAGGFQILKNTLRGAASALGLDPDKTKFTPDVQRRLADYVARTQGLGAWEGFKMHPAELETARRFMAGSGGSEAGVNVTSMNSDFKARLDKAFAAAAQATGEMLGITSGFRSHEHQQRLFDASDRSGHMVARPGHSMHERGLAADIGPQGQRTLLRHGRALEWLHQHAREFGLNFPMDWEPWHIEPMGARSGAFKTGMGNTNIHAPHTTNVTVNGVSDPQQAADAIRGVARRQAARHIRHMKTAVA